MINLNNYSSNKLYNIVYYDYYLDLRGGGPTGYLANLCDGLNRIGNDDKILTFFDVHNKPSINTNAKKELSVEERKKRHVEYVHFLHNLNDMYCNDELFNKIDVAQTRTIHVHTVGDAVKINNTLRRNGIGHIKTILTCHTPEPPSEEYYSSYIEDGYSEAQATEIRNGWKKVEVKAFTETPIVIFPSREAMDPLINGITSFERIMKDKNVRFVETGVKALNPTLTKEEAKKKYGVEGRFVVGYIGRHNAIKGYDVLVAAAESVMQKNKNICFLIGGKQTDSFLCPDNERWKELGWVNPADMLMAVDVFVLPNRNTFFDLVLLEVMSMGIPVIASNTGGNITVHNSCNSIRLYDTCENLVEEIIDLASKGADFLDSEGKALLETYHKIYTNVEFAKRYQRLINEIYGENKWI